VDGTPPNGCRPARCHHRGRRNADADAHIVTHNTLSADVTHVEVFYPFHPLHGYRLRVLRKPKKSDGAVAVVDPIGKRLKIPAWMLSPVAGKAEIASQAYLSRESLLSLVTLLESTGVKSDNLLQTSADKSKGDRHAATATAKPGSNRRRTRNRRSSG
jgi:hypothetical protein